MICFLQTVLLILFALLLRCHRSRSNLGRPVDRIFRTNFNHEQLILHPHPTLHPASDLFFLFCCDHLIYTFFHRQWSPVILNIELSEVDEDQSVKTMHPKDDKKREICSDHSSLNFFLKKLLSCFVSAHSEPRRMELFITDCDSCVINLWKQSLLEMIFSFHIVFFS